MAASWIVRAYRKSVFYPLDLTLIKHTNEILASYFHRVAAIQYFIFLVWGISVLLTPSLWDFRDLQDWIGVAVAPVSLAAFTGATFFPLTARLEMFAASSFIGLYTLYVITVAMSDRGLTIVGWVVSLSFVLVPAARVTFVFRTLIKRYGE